MLRWQNEYTQTKTLADDLIIQYGYKANRDSDAIFRTKQNLLQSKLNSLSSELFAIKQSPAEHNASLLDVQRAEQELNTLKTRASEQLGISAPQQLFGAKGPANVMSLDAHRVMEQHDSRISDQDKKIEVLSRIVGQTGDIAIDLQHQLNEQSPLISNINTKIEHTNVKVAKSTQKAVTLQNKAATCSLWCIIILLLIAICLVAFL
eukprot:TRINITY_DN2912_c0_g1_i1.p1 TRINITY_DN2912_c0_g1~~TRINITY_DN2912_c0_g1_i1.p1  ORF type:complete len:206 (+),score=60.71 TRINITY_DN2912_c0_g1_i1:83-700(+)